MVVQHCSSHFTWDGVNARENELIMGWLQWKARLIQFKEPLCFEWASRLCISIEETIALERMKVYDWKKPKKIIVCEGTGGLLHKKYDFWEIKQTIYSKHKQHPATHCNAQLPFIRMKILAQFFICWCYQNCPVSVSAESSIYDSTTMDRYMSRKKLRAGISWIWGLG